MFINDEEKQRRIDKRLEKDTLYNVGDIVTIRSVEDMTEEFGGLGSVLYYFPDTMFCYCGKTFKITDKILNNDSTGYKYWLDTTYIDMKEAGYKRSYMFSSDMFELPSAELKK